MLQYLSQNLSLSDKLSALIKIFVTDTVLFRTQRKFKTAVTNNEEQSFYTVSTTYLSEWLANLFGDQLHKMKWENVWSKSDMFEKQA